MNLPQDFLERMKAELGAELGGFLKSYDNPPVKGVRVNTLKISTEKFEEISPIKLDGKVAWEESGFYTADESLGKTIEHAAGLYYVQEPSAMCAVPELEIKPGERVLDLCSAPGGKGTQIAQYMDGDGVLVLNEINSERNKILKSNAERLGVKNAIVTLADPDDMAGLFSDYFDKILVDAPCSGEGMFKKEPFAIPEWSMENVKMCAQRQQRILENANSMLACGGRLVYSTCTFAPEEDERQVENFLKAHKNYRLVNMKKLLPHKIRGEGHFCAALEKTDGERRDLPLKTIGGRRQDENLKIYREWEAQTLKIRQSNVYSDNGIISAFCDGSPENGYWAKKHSVFCGRELFLGKCSNGRFEPSHRLAMILNAEEANCIDVDRDTAFKYLRGLTFDANCAEKGWNIVTFKGYPLGWCKVSVGVAKNHLPKGLRI